MKEYKIRDTETIYDVANKLYGEVSYVQKILLDNKNIISGINDDVSNKTIIYDETIYSTVQKPLIINTPAVSDGPINYKPHDGQTIFDISLMLNGDIENILSLVKNSTLDNINSEINITDKFTYTPPNNAVTNWVAKYNYVFKSQTPIVGIKGREFDNSFTNTEFD